MLRTYVHTYTHTYLHGCIYLIYVHVYIYRVHGDLDGCYHCKSASATTSPRHHSNDCSYSNVLPVLLRTAWAWLSR